MKKENSMKGIRKLGKNMIIFSIGSFASKLMGYFLIPFYTSVLSNVEYGIYDIVVTTVNLVFPLFTLLITESTMRFALDREGNSDKVFTLSFCVTGIGFIVLLIVSPLILISETYKDYYLFFIAYYLISTLNTLCSQFVKGEERTRDFAISGIIGTLAILLLNILLMVIIKLGLVGYFIATIVGTGISTLYLWISCDLSKQFCKLDKNDFILLKRMLRYSIPIMPNSLSWWISTSSDKYIISYFVGVAQTGLYSVAYKIPSLMTVFTTIFFNAWQISSVENFGSEESKKMYSNVYRHFFSVLVCIATLIITFVKLISKVLFLNDFYNAWQFVPFLIIAYLFHDLAAFIGSVYTSSKNTKMLFYSTLIGAAVNMGLNIILIPCIGAIGGAITTFISYFLVWLVRFFDIKRFFRIEYQYIQDISCLMLLFINVMITTLDIKYSFFIGLFISLMIITIKCNTICFIIKTCLNALKNYVKIGG